MAKCSVTLPAYLSVSLVSFFFFLFLLLRFSWCLARLLLHLCRVSATKHRTFLGSTIGLGGGGSVPIHYNSHCFRRWCWMACGSHLAPAQSTGGSHLPIGCLCCKTCEICERAAMSLQEAPRAHMHLTSDRKSLNVLLFLVHNAVGLDRSVGELVGRT